MSTVESGSAYAIPLADDRWVLAQVLFNSGHFKDAILVGVDPKLLDECPDSMPGIVTFDGLNLWTSSTSASHYWQFLGLAPLPEDHLERTRRVVGGGVWLGDDFLHPASDQQLEELPKMLAYGNFALIQHIASALGT